MRMLRASMCAMNRSENSGCSCSVRTISRFWIRSTVVGITAVAVPMRSGLPGQAPLPEEVARPEHGHDRLFAPPRTAPTA